MAADAGGWRPAAPHKLPLNARTQPIDIAPAGRARAGGAAAHSYDLGLLARPPSSAGSDSPRRQPPPPPQQQQPPAAMGRTEVARRLRQHLVTRPASSSGAVGPRQQQQQQQQQHPQRALPHSFNEAALLWPGAGRRGPDSDAPAATVVADPLLLPSGDVTHQIYRWQSKNNAAGEPIDGAADCGRHGQQQPQQQQPQRRRRSFSGWDSDSDWDVPLRPGQINVPGGFRRQFVRERAERLGRAPPGFIAETFVDFVALYGHFAGGNYLSDEDREYFEYAETEPEPEAAPAPAPEPERAPSERTPLRPAAPAATASSKKAFFLLIKAFVGTGVLVLPRAFYNGGLLTSCALMVAVAWYAWHCILLLGEVYLRVGGGSYSDIGLRLYGRWMQCAVTASIVLAQIGGCCAYTIFVAQNWRSVAGAVGGPRARLSTEFWILAQAAVFVPLALIRQIRYFAPVALVANVLIIGSLAYLLGFDAWSIAARGPAPFANYNPARLPLLVGTAVYSFEGVTLVIPILESQRNKQGFARVLTLSVVLCLVLFLCVGSLSYLTFGESVQPVVLLNLPESSPWTLLVQLLYSVAILFSMPLQLFPAVKIMEAMLFVRSGRESKRTKWQKNLFRAATALLISLLAIFGADQLDNVVSLVGSFCLVPLSFIYPSAMHLRAVADSPWVRAKDCALIAVGIVTMVYVTYISIDTWGPPGSSP
ncbi:hypothetical protein H4R18_001046 [Coemansia javaensis]|uniref:Amino acid transporter transmembrane domain-containing protein n=1 Tax=Coemansia javaensis TaxID=2761396 RepID=A0A9W8LL97_9FUNG|nr:hypothetical protein H4R18_001046 [Coemansia javaensis]